jgi:hypothetical protein
MASSEGGLIRGPSLGLEKCGEEVFGGGIELLAKGGFVQSKSFGCSLIDGLNR